jgi:hypothetical protein
MPDRNHPSLPFDSEDAQEQELWQRMQDLPAVEPPEHLRRRFYEELETASAPTLGQRLRDWLGLSGNTGWITATACAVLGFGLAQTLSQPAPDDSSRLAVLEQNVALLNRELALDRMQAQTVSTRLLGVQNAGSLGQADPAVIDALLQRASEDRALSVRSAAIEALAPHLADAEVGDALMGLLEAADSPIVQLSLVDLVLRHGTGPQLERVRRLADTGALHPDLVRHVNNAIGSEV